ncbi:MAG: oxygen-independent coproporphyrinogen III oxidase-like protein [Betaproteobacteria bacterium]|nr:oxygen-independent coproporphyrinogen III oxidase-like protein [Betaproteobacteria bacterium]
MPVAAKVAKVALARPGEIRLAALPPLAVYVHMPWCVRKCPYCDFNSHEKKGDLPEDAYCAALLADLEHALPWIWGRRVSSIFFGGGTPSLFSARAIERLLSEVRSRVPVAPDAEITLEANPGTFEARKFHDFRAAGINRLSIGIQSFNDAHLGALGRIHSAAEARRAIEIAQADFDNINLDLMYGLPAQTLAEAHADISEAIGWGTAHLSAYQLTLEPNTVFHSHPPQLPEHDVAAQMQESVEEILAAAEFAHYETSAFARTGRRSRHNLNYWQFGDYLGLGAGAHGKISFSDRIERHARAKQPREYLALAREGKSIVEQRTVAITELPFEFMLNALRLVQGFPLALVHERTGLAISVFETALARGEAQGLLERDWQSIRPSVRGQRFLNDLLQLFLP